MARISSALSEREIQLLQSVCGSGRDLGILAHDTLVRGFGLHGNTDDPIYLIQCHSNDGTVPYDELFHGKE